MKLIANNQLPIIQVIFSNEQIIFLHSDDTIHCWNINKQLHEFGYYKHSGQISSATITFDQQTLALVSVEGKIYLLKVKNKKVFPEFTFHNDKVNCLAFSQDGRILASGSDDVTVCLIEIFSNKGKVCTLVFLNDQQTFIQGNENGNINMIYFDEKNINLIKIYGKDSLSLNGMQSSFQNAKITSSNGFDLDKFLQKDQ